MCSPLPYIACFTRILKLHKRRLINSNLTNITCRQHLYQQVITVAPLDLQLPHTDRDPCRCTYIQDYVYKQLCTPAGQEVRDPLHIQDYVCIQLCTPAGQEVRGPLPCTYRTMCASALHTSRTGGEGPPAHTGLCVHTALHTNRTGGGGPLPCTYRTMCTYSSAHQQDRR